MHLSPTSKLGYLSFNYGDTSIKARRPLSILNINITKYNYICVKSKKVLCDVSRHIDYCGFPIFRKFHLLGHTQTPRNRYV